MYDSVKAAFPAFIAKWEGSVSWMYLDVAGIVTTGRGLALFAPVDALRLPWEWVATGQPASSSAIQAEWLRVKSLHALQGHGGGAFAHDARLRLTDGGAALATSRKLAEIETELLKPGRFPAFATAPADAQLGLLRMAWAMGPAFADEGRWPAFHAAFSVRDWMGCSHECRMREEGQPEAFARSNDAVVVLFGNARAVERDGLDPEEVYWPRDLLAGDAAA